MRKYKRRIEELILILIVTLLLANNVQATEGIEQLTNLSSNSKVFEDITYLHTVDNLTYSIVKLSGTNVAKVEYCNPSVTGEVSIPDEVVLAGKIYTVKSISEFAFEECKSVLGISIPSTVTSISNNLKFHGENLKYINVHPNNMNYSSEDGVLFNKNKTRLIRYPMGKEEKIYEISNTVITVDTYSFFGCRNLENIVIPNSVTTFGNNVFNGCIGLKELRIPSSITSVQTDLFVNCKSLEKITFEYIENYVVSQSDFDGCESLKEIIVLDSYNDYYYSDNGILFLKQSSSSIWITVYPNGKTEQEFVVPSGVNIIGESSFAGNKYLKNIEIPSSVRYINNGAFRDCINLEKIIIPSAVTRLDGTCFVNCPNLKEININSNNNSFCFENGILYNKTKTEIVRYLESNSITEFEIPYNITTIGISAFRNCKALENIIIPDSVTTIGESAFRECAFSSIEIPDSINKINYNQFKDCNNLTNIIIPDSITAIESYAFQNCSKLTNITIPDSIKKISSYTFSGCTSLLNITIPNSVTTIGSYSFESCNSLTKIVIPNSVKGIDTYAFFKCDNLTIIEVFGTDTMYINCFSFSKCNNLKEIKIYNLNSKIDGEAFSIINNNVKVYGFLNSTTETFAIQNGLNFVPFAKLEYSYNSLNKTATVTGVTNKNSLIGEYAIPRYIEYDGDIYEVTNIGESSFVNCNNLTNIILPNSITSIGDKAFQYCYGLTYMEIPDGVINVGNYVFSNCNNLFEVKIADTIEQIGQRTFERCKNLKKINLPNRLETLRSYLFMDCSNLSEIEIPDSVTNIEGGVFTGTSIISLDLSKNIKTIGKFVFTRCSKLEEINVNSENQKFLSENGILFNKAKTELLIYPAGKKDISEFFIPDNIIIVGEAAFYGAEYLTNIIIPSTVTTIETEAFEKCNGLKNITIPDTVTSMGTYVFNESKNLTEVVLPIGLSKTEIGTFYGCSSLEKISIPENVVEIGASTFNGCTNLSEIIIPENVSTIGSFAFQYCKALTDIKIPSKVTKIQKLTFNGCTNLKNIDIPNTVQTIEERSFTGCSSLETINLPYGITYIGEHTFSSCSSLKEIDIPITVTVIENDAFWLCKSLEKIEIPIGVTSIESYCFNGCSNLKSIIIPETVTKVESSSFKGIHGDAIIYGYAGSTAENYATTNSINFIPFADLEYSYNSSNKTATVTGVSDDATLVGEYAIPNHVMNELDGEVYTVTSIASRVFFDTKGKDITGITIPETVTSIGDYAFAYCEKLNYVEFLENSQLNSIAQSAFYNDEKLEKFNMPVGVTNIGQRAFYNCTNLENVTLPEKLEKIGDAAFHGTNIGNVFIPKTVTSIGEWVFESCPRIEEIVVDYENINYSSVDGVLFNKDKTLLIKYPEGNFKTKYTIPNTVTTIAGCGFQYTQNLTNIIIPNSVTTIENDAFRKCYNLKSIVIPNSITTLEQFAFADCAGLEKVTFEDNSKITEVGGYLFLRCKNLKKVDFGENPSITSFSYDMFEDCDSLISINVPKTVNTIYGAFGCENLVTVTFEEGSKLTKLSSSFLTCKKLRYIELPETVTELDGGVFQSCYSLTNIRIPSRVPALEKYAFNYCYSLKQISLPYSVNSLGEYSLTNCTDLETVEILNKNATINDRAMTKTDILTIYGFTGSTAETFATTNDINFIPFADLEYSFDSTTKTATVVGVKSGVTLNGEYAIPSQIKNDADGLVYDVTTIGENVFKECEDLSYIKIPSSITHIKESAFEGCTGLTSIVIPKNVAYIDEYGFKNCSNLKKIEILSENIVIAENAFLGISEEAVFYGYEGGNTASLAGDMGLGFETIEELIYSFDTTEKTAIITGINPGAVLDENYIIPSEVVNEDDGEIYKVTGIDSGVFYSNSEIQKVTIPSSITSIGDFAFANCTKLKEIEILNKETTVNSSVFSGINEEATIYGYFGSTAENYAVENNIAFIPIAELNYTYDEESKTAIVSSPKDRNALVGDYAIPSQVVNEDDGEIYTVIELARYSFLRSYNLTGIVIPNTVTSIDNYVFEECENLKSVSFSDSLISIGDRIFFECTSLEKIEIPNTVTTMGKGVFYGCINLKEVHLSNSLRTINDSLFSHCDNLSNVVIPDGVTYIGSGAFTSCSNLKTVNIPDSVTSINTGVFLNCTSLERITLPSGVTRIPQNTFNNCPNLVEVNILGNVSIIDSSAFYNCKKLSNITIPSSVYSIGANAFTFCESLSRIDISSNVRTIGNEAFRSCKGLQEFSVDINNTKYASENGVLFNKDKTTLMQYPSAKSDILEYIIPSTVTKIETYAFSNCSNLENVTIPESVTEIARYTFTNSEKITTINLPSTITKIGNSAFSNCKSLNNIVLLEGLTALEGYAFSGCSSLKNLAIPNTVTTISGALFKDCTSLETVSLPNSMTKIGRNFFYGCTSLKNIEIPDTVTSIEETAFAGCLELTNVKMSNSIETIGEMAFINCEKLESIEIPNTITTIEDRAFHNCLSLKTLSIPGKIDSVGEYVFEKCTSLENLLVTKDIDESLQKLLDRCNKLNNIRISDEITKIDNTDLAFCNSLKNIVIPKTVTSIEETAFYDKTFTIFGNSDSEAKTFAEEKGINFMASEDLNYIYDNENKTATIHGVKDGITLSEKYTIPSKVINEKGEICTITTIGGLIERNELKEVIIPNTITTISRETFYGCANIERIEIPECVENIYPYAFANCTKLKDIVLPSRLKVIDLSIFKNCTELTDINIPTEVERIGPSAFYGCTNLEKVEIPENVTLIAKEAFANCTNLKEVIVHINDSSKETKTEWRENIFTVDTLNENFIMKVRLNSSAENYAKTNNIPYEIMDIAKVEKDGKTHSALTLQEAINNADNQSTVTLLTNVEEEIVIEKDLTIDLSNKEINGKIENKGTLKIEKGKVLGTIINNGTLELNGNENTPEAISGIPVLMNVGEVNQESEFNLTIEGSITNNSILTLSNVNVISEDIAIKSDNPLNSITQINLGTTLKAKSSIIQDGLRITTPEGYYLKTTEDGEYKVGTLSNEYNYTIKYFYDDVEDESKRETILSNYGTVINEYTDKIEEIYNFVKTENYPLTVTNIEENNVIKVYYERKPAKVIVKHIDRNTGNVISTVEENGKVQDTYNTVSKDMYGYVLVESPENANGTMTLEDKIVNYYYVRVSKGVIEKHVDMVTNEIIYNKVHEGNEGDPYEVNVLDSEEYMVVEEKLPTNTSGIMTKDAITVTYFYMRKTTVKALYVDKNSNETLDEILIEGFETKAYKTEEKTFEGYVLLEKPSNAEGSMKVLKDAEGNVNTETVVTYYYKKSTGGVIERHYDVITNTLLEEEKKHYGLEGDPYKIEPKKFEGYAIVDDRRPTNAEGTMTVEQIVVNYYYIRKATVKVEYINVITNEKVIDDVIINKHEGESYETERKSFESYVLLEDKLPENEKGTIVISKDEQGNLITETIVKYYYVHKSAGVIEKHIDIISNELLEAETKYTGNEGDTYKTAAKTFEGYDLVEDKLPENAEGTLKPEVIKVIYYYVRKSSVKVEYLEKETEKKLGEDIIISGHEGDEYKTEAKEFTGYKLVENPENAEGKIKAKEVVIKYYYELIKDEEKEENKDNNENNQNNNEDTNTNESSKAEGGNANENQNNGSGNSNSQTITIPANNSSGTTTTTTTTTSSSTSKNTNTVTTTITKTDNNNTNIIESSNENVVEDNIVKTGDIIPVIAVGIIVFVIASNIIITIIIKKKKKDADKDTK